MGTSQSYITLQEAFTTTRRNTCGEIAHMGILAHCITSKSVNIPSIANEAGLVSILVLELTRRRPGATTTHLEVRIEMRV